MDTAMAWACTRTCTPMSCGCAFMACSAASAPPPSTMARLFSGLRRARTDRAAQLCSHTCGCGWGH